MNVDPTRLYFSSKPKGTCVMQSESRHSFVPIKIYFWLCLKYTTANPKINYFTSHYLIITISDYLLTCLEGRCIKSYHTPGPSHPLGHPSSRFPSPLLIYLLPQTSLQVLNPSILQQGLAVHFIHSSHCWSPWLIRWYDSLPQSLRWPKLTAWPCHSTFIPHTQTWLKCEAETWMCLFVFAL